MSNLPKVELKLLELTKERLRMIRPTKVADIRETNSGSFHEDGLFSTTTFGRAGTVERDTTFSYIPINTTVFHPLYYRELMKLRMLYGDILTGNKYAIFNEEEKDFELSDPIHGDTGYHFFVSNFPKLEFKRNKSRRRDARIDFLTKYRPVCMYSQIMVLPAGLRDSVEDKNGRTTEGEINEFYRRILRASNSLASQSRSDSSINDTSRASIQNGFNQVYDYLSGLIKGKKGFISGKWAKRAVATGSRSVITSLSTSTRELGDESNIGFNNSAIGLFQACKSYMPLLAHEALAFTNPLMADGNSRLVDKNTLQSVTAQLPDAEIDRWTTPSGIEKTVNNFGDLEFRTQPIVIGNDYYLALIWTGVVDGKKVYRIIQDIRDIPEGFSRESVRPITYTEFFYLVRLNEWNKDIYYITRYPVTGDGSIYPSIGFIRTTVNSEVRYGLGDDWKIDLNQKAGVFPILKDASFMDSLSVHPARLEGMGGDHDGDKTSSLSIFLDDARQEVYDYLNKPEAYINGDKKMIATAYVDSVERVLINITGD